MKFLIIGGGNLGYDLAYAAKAVGDTAVIWNATDADHNVGFNPDVMIYTPGGGITDTPDVLWKKNIEDCWIYRDKYAPKHTFTFSSNAALQPNQSYYALIKHYKEHCYSVHPQYSIRINSLYGLHRARLCFPNKLLENEKTNRWGQSFCGLPPKFPWLPENPIVPTPTAWLAEKVIDYILAGDYKKVISIAPQGETTPLEWGKLILGGNYEVKSAGMADDRPTTSFVSDILYLETWLDLWKKYGPVQIGKSSGG